ncbi:MAG: class I SAM-dependent methyltransferase, partial [Dehalococcoidia bacterium]|nr:class I SAM-dependent methyltransferase [Dehalococcoidia bacterium]
MATAPDPRDDLRRRWTAYAAVWQRWRPKYRRMSRPATEALLAAADLAAGHHALDLACGVGDPAIDVARHVGPSGRAIAIDFVRPMAEAAAANARADGVALQTATADAEALPFPNDTFDRVTSRFGIMLVPDVAQALREARRVLKPGGVAAFLVWGPREHSSYFSVFYDAVLARVAAPPTPPDAPGPFR